MPDRSHEKRLGGLVAGIDEVGRGPLAGPVVAAAVILQPRLPRALKGLDDSKRLDAEQRVHYSSVLRGCAVIGLGAASVEEIDRINILQATFLAMSRALAALRCRPDAVLIDGNRAPPLSGYRVETLVGGDALSLSIAAASVMAKVARDRAMKQLHERYGNYGWGSNVGYGTAAHLRALEIHGVTRHHRRSFAPVRRCLGLTPMDVPGDLTTDTAGGSECDGEDSPSWS